MGLVNKKGVYFWAHQLLNKSVGVIEGCRLIRSYFWSDDLTIDDDYWAIVGIDSETDHLPIGNSQKEVKNTVKKEIDECVEFFESSALEACQGLIAKYPYRLLYLTEDYWKVIPEDELIIKLNNGKTLHLSSSMAKEGGRFILILDDSEYEILLISLKEMLDYISSKHGDICNDTAEKIKKVIDIWH